MGAGSPQGAWGCSPPLWTSRPRGLHWPLAQTQHRPGGIWEGLQRGKPWPNPRMDGSRPLGATSLKCWLRRGREKPQPGDLITGWGTGCGAPGVVPHLLMGSGSHSDLPGAAPSAPEPVCSSWTGTRTGCVMGGVPAGWGAARGLCSVPWCPDRPLSSIPRVVAPLEGQARAAGGSGVLDTWAGPLCTRTPRPAPLHQQGAEDGGQRVSHSCWSVWRHRLRGRRASRSGVSVRALLDVTCCVGQPGLASWLRPLVAT